MFVGYIFGYRYCKRRLHRYGYCTLYGWERCRLLHRNRHCVYGCNGPNRNLSRWYFGFGAGSATFAITGTPSAAGTASFAISLGGQSCTLALTVTAASTSMGGTAWSVDTDIAKIVAAAEAFKATLGLSQVSSAQYSYTVAQAKLWSNLPQSLYKGRVGLASSTFSAAQWTAFYNLLKAATGTGSMRATKNMRALSTPTIISEPMVATPVMVRAIIISASLARQAQQDCGVCKSEVTTVPSFIPTMVAK